MTSFISSLNQPTHYYFQLHETGRVLGERVISEETPRSEKEPVNTEILERGYTQVGNSIGYGGYSTILKVESSFDSIRYALKLPKSSKWNKDHLNESKMLRFLSAQSAEDMQGIVKWEGTFWIDRKPAIVLELLRKDLQGLIRETDGRGLSLKKTEILARQLCKTLIVLKRHHIIHFDIKPGNIAFVDGDIHRMKLIDFEGAFFEDSPPEIFTKTKETSSPEVLLGKTPFDSSCDMWSFAVAITEAYIGCDLFKITPLSDIGVAFFQESRLRQKFPKSLVAHFSEGIQGLWEKKTIDTSCSSFEELMNRAAERKSESIHVLKIALQALFKFDPKERISPEDASKLFEPIENEREASV